MEGYEVESKLLCPCCGNTSAIILFEPEIIDGVQFDSLLECSECREQWLEDLSETKETI